MRRLRIVWTPLAALASLGMLRPFVGRGVGAGAGEERKRADRGQRRGLGRRRRMQGVVVDIHGMPRSGVEVALAQHKTRLSLAKTDLQGRFRLAGVKGGVYQLQSSGQVRFVRAWTAEAAPPAARPLALMVVGSEVVRGQMPLEDFCVRRRDHHRARRGDDRDSDRRAQQRRQGQAGKSVTLRLALEGVFRGRGGSLPAREAVALADAVPAGT